MTMKKTKTKKPPVLPVKHRDDTFTTASGQTMTRRQLQNLVSKANYKIEHAKEYMSSSMHREVKKMYKTKIAATGTQAKGADKLSLKGITDAKQLRKIEAAAREALASHYTSKKRYHEIEDKRYETFKKKGLVTTQKEYDLLIKLFSSEAWKRARANKDFIYEQFLQMLQDEVFAQGQATPQTIELLQEVLTDFAAADSRDDWEAPSGSAVYKTPTYKKSLKRLEPSTWDELTEQELDDVESPGFSDFDDDEELAEAMIEALQDKLRGR